MEVEPTKTKLLEFGRFAKAQARQRGQEPESFDFLGFTHYCGETRYGCFKVKRRTSAKKFRGKLKEIKSWLRQARHRHSGGELLQRSKSRLDAVSGRASLGSSFTRLSPGWVGPRCDGSNTWIRSGARSTRKVTEEPDVGKPLVRFCEGLGGNRLKPRVPILLDPGGAQRNPGEKLGWPSMSPHRGARGTGSSFRHPLQGFLLFWLVHPGFRYAPPGATRRHPLQGFVPSEIIHSNT